MLHTECAKRRKVNCIQHVHFHKLASLVYNLLVVVHEFQSACDEIEQVKRLIQEKGSKRSNTFHVTEGMPTLQFSCNDCIVIQASHHLGHCYKCPSSYLPSLAATWSSSGLQYDAEKS